MKRIALLPGGLRARFIAAFACMSILPLLVCLYVVSEYVLPTSGSIWLASVIFLLTMLISFCGFYIMEKVVDSVINLSREARRLAWSYPGKGAESPGEDEVDLIRETLSALARDAESKGKRLSEVEVVDAGVGACTERHVRRMLGRELKRAELYRRPCAIVVVQIRGTSSVEQILKAEGNRLTALSCLTSFLNKFKGGLGTLGRFHTDGLCLVLPEHTRKQAHELAEKIKSESGDIYWDVLSSLYGWDPDIVVHVAAAPVDGMEVAQLFSKCMEARPREFF